MEWNYKNNQFVNNNNYFIIKNGYKFRINSSPIQILSNKLICFKPDSTCS